MKWRQIIVLSIQNLSRNSCDLFVVLIVVDVGDGARLDTILFLDVFLQVLDHLLVSISIDGFLHSSDLAVIELHVEIVLVCEVVALDLDLDVLHGRIVLNILLVCLIVHILKLLLADLLLQCVLASCKHHSAHDDRNESDNSFSHFFLLQSLYAEKIHITGNYIIIYIMMSTKKRKVVKILPSLRYGKKRRMR